MNYVEAYIVLSCVLIAGLLGIRRIRRQQLVQYVQTHHRKYFQQLADNTQTDDERFKQVLNDIEHGELSQSNDSRLGDFCQQLKWLNWLPVIILIAGFILASIVQP